MIFLGPLRQLSRLCTASLSVFEKKIVLFIKMAVEISAAKDVEILKNLLFHIY